MFKIKRPKSFSEFLYQTAINFAMILIAFYSIKWLGMPLIDRSMVSSAKQGSIENVKFKLDYLYADVNAQDKMGYAAIHHAADKGNTNLVKVLLDHGADVNRETKNGKVALEFALKNKHSKMIDMLLSQKINAKTATDALQFLATENFYYKPEVPHRSRTPYNEQIKVTLGEKFIKLGADVNEVIHPAVGYDELALVALLIKHGADINYKDKEDENKCPMFRVRSAEMVNYLVGHGGEVDCEDKIGFTPLYLAPNKTTITKLLDNGADVNHIALNMKRPIMIQETFLEIFINYGADINITGNYGRSLLHTAKNKNVCIALIANGIPVNVKDSHKSTPLQTTIIRSNNIEVLQCLLDAGADVYHRDEWGKTALMYAKEQHKPNREVISLLEKKMR